MITVRVKLFATLRNCYPDLELGAELPVRMPIGSTIADVSTKLELPAEQVKVVFVNHKIRDDDFVLVDNDRVSFFPPVGGG